MESRDCNLISPSLVKYLKNYNFQVLYHTGKNKNCGSREIDNTAAECYTNINIGSFTPPHTHDTAAMPSLNVKITTPRLERPRRKRCLSPYSFIFAQDIDVLESPRGRATHMNEFTQASPSAAEVEGAKQAATTTPSSHKIKQPRNKGCPSPYSIIFAEDIVVLEEPHQQSEQQGPAGQKAVVAARVTAVAVVDPAKKLEETSSGDDIDATVVNDSLNENDQEDAECDQPEFF